MERCLIGNRSCQKGSSAGLPDNLKIVEPFTPTGFQGLLKPDTVDGGRIDIDDFF